MKHINCDVKGCVSSFYSQHPLKLSSHVSHFPRHVGDSVLFRLPLSLSLYLVICIVLLRLGSVTKFVTSLAARSTPADTKSYLIPVRHQNMTRKGGKKWEMGS